MQEIKAPAIRAFRLTSDFFGAREGATVYSYSGATYGTVGASKLAPSCSLVSCR